MDLRVPLHPHIEGVVGVLCGLQGSVMGPGGAGESVSQATDPPWWCMEFTGARSICQLSRIRLRPRSSISWARWSRSHPSLGK